MTKDNRLEVIRKACKSNRLKYLSAKVRVFCKIKATINKIEDDSKEILETFKDMTV